MRVTDCDVIPDVTRPDHQEGRAGAGGRKA